MITGQVEKFKIYRNVKNQELYIILGTCVNQTIKNTGQLLFMYKKAGLNRTNYVKDYIEFMEEFEEYEPSS